VKNQVDSHLLAEEHKIESEYRLRSLLKKFSEDNVEVDRSFQRREVWSKKQKCEYVESFAKGWAVSKFVFAQVREAKEYFEDPCSPTKCTNSKHYYQEMYDRAKYYINIDAQNRLVTLRELYNNEFAFTGWLRNNEGVDVYIKNKFYKDFPESVKLNLEQTATTVTRFNTLTVDELSELYIALNAGVKQSAQEMRNAIKSAIAEWVRDMSSDFAPLFKHLVSKKHIARMVDDELVAKFALSLIREYRQTKDETTSSKGKLNTPVGLPLGKSELDYFYNRGKAAYSIEDEDNSPYLSSELERVEGILYALQDLVISNEGKLNNKIIPARVCWALLHACTHIYDSDCRVLDQDVLYDLVVNTDISLYADSQAKFAAEVKSALKNDRQTPSESAFYHRQSQLPHQSGDRASRSETLIDKLKSSSKFNSLLAKKEVDQIKEDKVA